MHNDYAYWRAEIIKTWPDTLKNFQAKHNLSLNALSTITGKNKQTLTDWMRVHCAPNTPMVVRNCLEKMQKWEEDRRLAGLRLSNKEAMERLWVGNRVQQRKEAPPGVVLIPAEQ